MRTAARSLGELLITAGLVLLLFVAYQLVWTNYEAHRRADRVADDIREAWARPPATGGDRAPGEAPEAAKVDFGEGFAFLHIPRLGASWSVPVVKGVRLSDLARGIGHYPETARPGAVGNFAVAGHRATNGEPFAALDKLRAGDVVVAETRRRWFTYVVDRTKIVTPELDVGARPGARQAPCDADGAAGHADDLQPALGVVRAADRLRAPRGQPATARRAARRARPGRRQALMYAWIWRHLPGPWPVRTLLAAAAVAAVVLVLLFTQVFPWAEDSLPFLQVTVDE